MIKKNLAIVLLIIAIILVGFSIYVSLNDNEKLSNNPISGQGSLESGGKIGIVILPPEVEDKGNGN